MAEDLFTELCHSAAIGASLAACDRAHCSMLECSALSAGEVPRRHAASRPGQIASADLGTFMALTGADASTARRLIARHKGEVDAAVASFFDGAAVADESTPANDASNPWLLLPDNVVALVLSTCSAANLSQLSATCRHHRSLLPEATVCRARRLGLKMRETSEATLVGMRTVDTSDGRLAFLTRSCRAWTVTWPLRVVEALALTEATALWRQGEWGGGLAALQIDAASGRPRHPSNSICEEPKELELDCEAMLRSVLRTRARAIIRRLIGEDLTLARAASGIGAMGVRPDLCLPSGIYCRSQFGCPARKPKCYDVIISPTGGEPDR